MLQRQATCVTGARISHVCLWGNSPLINVCTSVHLDSVHGRLLGWKLEASHQMGSHRNQEGNDCMRDSKIVKESNGFLTVRMDTVY